MCCPIGQHGANTLGMEKQITITVTLPGIEPLVKAVLGVLDPSILGRISPVLYWRPKNDTRPSTGGTAGVRTSSEATRLQMESGVGRSNTTFRVRLITQQAPGLNRGLLYVQRHLNSTIRWSGNLTKAELHLINQYRSNRRTNQ